MKIKIDYVTNSSSASFVIMRCDLTPLQELLIMDHIEAATMMLENNVKADFGYIGKYDGWDINVFDDRIEGDTSMDNFDILEFLKVIGVPDDAIEYDHYG